MKYKIILLFKNKTPTMKVSKQHTVASTHLSYKINTSYIFLSGVSRSDIVTQEI